MENDIVQAQAQVNEVRTAVRTCLASGADVESGRYDDDNGNSLLHLCVSHNLLDCVISLIFAGANLHTPNSDGLSALDLALENGNQVLIQLIDLAEEYKLFVQATSDSNSNSSDKSQYFGDTKNEGSTNNNTNNLACF